MCTSEDSGSGTRAEFQISPDESPSEAVLRGVAALSGRPVDAAAAGPAEPLAPLAAAVDPGALDRLFQNRPLGVAGAAHVEFAYAGYIVTVSRSGTVSVRADGSPDAEDSSGT